jgi:hypothetical protein
VRRKKEVGKFVNLSTISRLTSHWSGARDSLALKLRFSSRGGCCSSAPAQSYCHGYATFLCDALNQ